MATVLNFTKLLWSVRCFVSLDRAQITKGFHLNFSEQVQLNNEKVYIKSFSRGGWAKNQNILYGWGA